MAVDFGGLGSLKMAGFMGRGKNVRIQRCRGLSPLGVTISDIMTFENQGEGEEEVGLLDLGKSKGKGGGGTIAAPFQRGKNQKKGGTNRPGGWGLQYRGFILWERKKVGKN